MESLNKTNATKDFLWGFFVAFITKVALFHPNSREQGTPCPSFRLSVWQAPFVFRDGTWGPSNDPQKIRNSPLTLGELLEELPAQSNNQDGTTNAESSGQNRTDGGLHIRCNSGDSGGQSFRARSSSGQEHNLLLSTSYTPNGRRLAKFYLSGSL